MQIVLIIVFGILLALPGRNPFSPVWPDPSATLAIALGGTLLVPLMVATGGWLSLRRLRRAGGFADAAATFGRVHAGMRFGLLALFGLLLSQTGWLPLVRVRWDLDRWPLVDELVIAAPVILGAVLCWLAMYPADRGLRQAASAGLEEDPSHQPVWTLPQYMDFQVRNQVLTVLVPLSLFVVASDLIDAYRHKLIDATWNTLWAPEAILAVTAGTVFVLSPAMLRLIWRTQRLPDSPLRARLEQICRRAGLRYRDILVWQSHGVMINAAVMGLLPQIRYILLSDGLLEHLSDAQVEAVFGHEAGHVQEHHIAYYMIFAIGSMMGVSLGAFALDRATDLSQEAIELIAGGAIALVWIALFGWISRRFERQADVAGVRSLGSVLETCTLPCWRHSMQPSPATGEPICATAAQVFSSALHSVAALNGISRSARSWRHSSIASRQAFLQKAAMHPEVLWRFERVVGRLKFALVIVTFLIALIGAWTYWPILWPQPRHREPLRPKRPGILVREEGVPDGQTAERGLIMARSFNALARRTMSKVTLREADARAKEILAELLLSELRQTPEPAGRNWVRDRLRGGLPAGERPRQVHRRARRGRRERQEREGA